MTKLKRLDMFKRINILLKEILRKLKNKETFRIHGDNILECERTLHLIAKSLNAEVSYQDSPIHNPIYLVYNPNT